MKWSRRGASEDGIDMAVRNWGVLFRLSSCSRHEYFSSLLSCQSGPVARRLFYLDGSSHMPQPEQLNCRRTV